MESWAPYLKFYGTHSIEAPFYVLLSPIRVRGKTITAGEEFYLNPVPYRRDNLLLYPFEVSAERVQTEALILFQPLFETIANAFGLARSPVRHGRR